jgi:hypothetical protein
MKERIANLVFLRNRLRSRRNSLAMTAAGAEIVRVEAELRMVERNLDELQKLRMDEAVAFMRRPA